MVESPGSMTPLDQGWLEILLEPILSALRSLAFLGPLPEPGPDGSGYGCSCLVRISEPIDNFHIICQTVENASGRRGN
jgi:hypothetical protein